MSVLPPITRLCWPTPSRADSTSLFSTAFIAEVFCTGCWTERKRDALLFPQGPQDKSGNLSQMRRGFGHSVRAHHLSLYPQDKAPGKKKIRLYPGIYGLFFSFIIITHLPKLRIKLYFLSPSSREFPKFRFPMTQSWCQKRCNNKSLQSWGKQDSPFSAQDGSHLHCSQISKYFIDFNRAAQKNTACKQGAACRSDQRIEKPGLALQYQTSRTKPNENTTTKPGK